MTRTRVIADAFGTHHAWDLWFDRIPCVGEMLVVGDTVWSVGGVSWCVPEYSAPQRETHAQPVLLLVNPRPVGITPIEAWEGLKNGTIPPSPVATPGES